MRRVEGAYPEKHHFAPAEGNPETCRRCGLDHLVRTELPNMRNVVGVDSTSEGGPYPLEPVVDALAVNYFARRGASSERLAAIHARLDAVPGGPWTIEDGIWQYVSSPSGVIVNEWGDFADREPLAQFVAHAPDDIAYLLAEIARLSK